MSHISISTESFGIADSGSTISAIAEQIRKFQDYNSVSLTQFTKRTNVYSRAFIDQAVVDDPIMSPLLMMLHQMYIGFILSALELSQQVDGSRTIRDIVNVVATENHKPWRDVLMVAQEGFARMDDKDAYNGPGMSSSVSDLNPNAEYKLPTAKNVEVTFSLGNKKVSCNLLVQMNPTVIPVEVAKQFVAMNFTPSIKQRYLQYSAGEIKFWRDFVAQRDILSKRRKALKQDNTGALKDMIDRQANALSNNLLKKTLISPEKQNIANTVLIFDKKTFTAACSDSGMNFNLASNRDRFFSQTYAMFVVVVDTMYNKVEIWFNGIDHKAEYTFSMITANTKGGGKFDLKDIMSAYSQGVIPKF